MYTIVIPVSKERPEDDILNLVEILSAQLPDSIIRSSDALVVETDLANVAAIFKAIAGAVIPVNTQTAPKEKKYRCLDCDLPVSKPNCRCRVHAKTHIRAKKNNGRAVLEIEPS